MQMIADIAARTTDGAKATFYPDHLLPALQSTLAVLADLDIRHEIDRDYLEEWSGPDEVRRHLRARPRPSAGWAASGELPAVPAPPEAWQLLGRTGDGKAQEPTIKQLAVACLERIEHETEPALVRDQPC